MKKMYLFLVQTLVILSLAFAVGCSEDDDNGSSVSDPEGTIMFTMTNSGVGYINEGRYGAAVTFVPRGWNAIELLMLDNNNFYGWLCTIANVGKVKGLGAITKIPSSGFVKQTSVEKGYGYVIFIKENGLYARLYVTDWVLSTSGGIIGAKVKYQYPFEP